MARKTIYIRDDAEELWKEAERLSGDSISALLTRLLEGYVANRTQLGGTMTRIEVDVVTGDNEDVVTKAFEGRWLVTNMETEDDSSRWFAGTTWSIAVSKRGAIVVCAGDRDGVIDSFELYNSLDAADEACPPDVISAAANAMGERYVQELDI